MEYTTLTNKNSTQMIKSYINAFNGEPNNDEWTEQQGYYEKSNSYEQNPIS